MPVSPCPYVPHVRVYTQVSEKEGLRPEDVEEMSMDDGEAAHARSASADSAPTLDDPEVNRTHATRVPVLPPTAVFLSVASLSHASHA